MTKYYRAIPSNCDCTTITPEEVDTELTYNDGVVVDTFDPIRGDFTHSNRKVKKSVLSFSKTPGGAIIGATSGKMAPSGGLFGGSPEKSKSVIRGGKFKVCQTEDKPDMEVKSPYLDFPILEEVRYTNPVKTTTLCEIDINEQLKNDIIVAIGAMVSELNSFEILESVLYGAMDDEEKIFDILDIQLPKYRARGDSKILALRDNFNKQCGVSSKTSPNLKQLLEAMREHIG